MQKQLSEAFFKRGAMKNFAEFTNTIHAGIAFFIKSKSVDCAGVFGAIFSCEVLRNS